MAAASSPKKPRKRFVSSDEENEEREVYHLIKFSDNTYDIVRNEKLKRFDQDTMVCEVSYKGKRITAKVKHTGSLEEMNEWARAYSESTTLDSNAENYVPPKLDSPRPSTGQNRPAFVNIQTNQQQHHTSAARGSDGQLASSSSQLVRHNLSVFSPSMSRQTSYPLIRHVLSPLVRQTSTPQVHHQSPPPAPAYRVTPPRHQATPPRVHHQSPPPARPATPPRNQRSPPGRNGRQASPPTHHDYLNRLEQIEARLNEVQQPAPGRNTMIVDGVHGEVDLLTLPGSPTIFGRNVARELFTSRQLIEGCISETTRRTERIKFDKESVLIIKDAVRKRFKCEDKKFERSWRSIKDSINGLGRSRKFQAKADDEDGRGEGNGIRRRENRGNGDGNRNDERDEEDNQHEDNDSGAEENQD